MRKPSVPGATCSRPGWVPKENGEIPDRSLGFPGPGAPGFRAEHAAHSSLLPISPGADRSAFPIESEIPRGVAKQVAWTGTTTPCGIGGVSVSSARRDLPCPLASENGWRAGRRERRGPLQRQQYAPGCQAEGDPANTIAGVAPLVAQRADRVDWRAFLVEARCRRVAARPTRNFADREGRLLHSMGGHGLGFKSA